MGASVNYYRRHARYIEVLAALALAVSVAACIVVFVLAHQRSSLVVRTGVLAQSPAAGLGEVRFVDADGIDRSVTLSGFSYRDPVGQEVVVGFPPGDPSHAGRLPDVTLALVIAGVAVLVPVALYEHHRRTLVRDALAHSALPTHPVAVMRERVKVGNTSYLRARIWFNAAQPFGLSDAMVTLAGRGAQTGGYEYGELVGDVRVGSPVVLWMNGELVPVRCNLRRGR